MPVTMIRLNLVEGLGPVLQLAEGYTVDLPERGVTTRWICAPTPPGPPPGLLPGSPARAPSRDVYSVMANWGANHGAFVYGHIGADLITLASMLRIPGVLCTTWTRRRSSVPHAWNAFGTKDREGADYRACAAFGPTYGRK